MKEYSTCVRDVFASNGHHPDYPRNPFQDWTERGWQINTAEFHLTSGRWVTIYALLEREVQPKEKS